MRKERAITLISLVITIIILIILASVAIYLSLGNNGIFVRSIQAKEVTNKQQATDIINLKITTAQMNKYAEKQKMPTLKELSEVLKEDNEIAYVTEESQIASKKYEVGENPSSIYTKLNDYPYEFEINSSLQLASINGVKIATNTKNSGYKETILYERTEENASETEITFSDNHTIDDFDAIRFSWGVNTFDLLEESEFSVSSLNYFIKKAYENDSSSKRLSLPGITYSYMELIIKENGVRINDAYKNRILYRIFGINY